MSRQYLTDVHAVYFEYICRPELCACFIQIVPVSALDGKASKWPNVLRPSRIDFSIMAVADKHTAIDSIGVVAQITHTPTASAFFLAELSVRSPRKFIIFII